MLYSRAKWLKSNPSVFLVAEAIANWCYRPAAVNVFVDSNVCYAYRQSLVPGSWQCC